MKPRPTLQKRALSILGPAVGIAIAYNFVFYSPLQRVLKAERTKLHKVETVANRKSNSQLISEKLAKAEAEIQSLNGQLSDAKQVGSHLVSRRADLRNEYLQSNSPATAMSETLALLSRNGLQCISSMPVISQNNDAPLAEALKPVAVLLDDSSSQHVDSLDRREMRITLRGRFQDIQSALREIQAAPLGVFTVSLEMDDSDAHTDIRIWILTIAV